MNHNDINIELNDNNNHINYDGNYPVYENNNYDNNVPARNFEENSPILNDIINIKEKNRIINRDKVGFFKFLIYSTKAEIHINSFKDLLYWTSLLEIFLFFTSILLFVSSPGNFSIFWTFIPHCIRGILGLIVLFRIPDSHLSIENIDNFDDSSIEVLQDQIITNFFKILQDNESRIKPILLCYFIFTIIDIIIDNIIFFYLLTKWNYQEYSFANVIGILIIIVFFSNFFLIF